MNWIGGARARAKLREQLNANSSRQVNPRNMVGDVDEDDEDASIESYGSDPGQRNNASSGGGDGGRKRKYVKKNANDDRIEACAKKAIDYEALGYSLVKRQKIQRRVVPLIEFVEKKFPNGHVLALHMSHVMDITRTPVVNPCTSELDTPIRRPPLSEATSGNLETTSLTSSKSSVII